MTTGDKIMNIYILICLWIVAIAAFTSASLCILLWDDGRGNTWFFIGGFFFLFLMTGILGAITLISP